MPSSVARFWRFNGSLRRDLPVRCSTPLPETFDLCDDRGRPLGIAKDRELVHHDGDWHRSFHCWVVDTTAPAEPAVVLQRRSAAKQTSPGLWDVSVGGHYMAGEGIEGGLREMQEELGLEVDATQLVRAGWRREVVVFENGLIEREIQDVFFLFRPLWLAQLHPDPTEVSGLARVPLDTLYQLAQSRLADAVAPGARVAASGRLETLDVALSPSLLVPRSGRYYQKATRFARRFVLDGIRPRPRWW